ncbi:hypothetical protein ACFFU8_18415 [Chromobacterium piscinae]|uniref:hypothetical protein n=1 Tax=Chromobacterium piscinae TaxID=686831 RepID=UPI001E2CBEEE|nr:hypothetical protein [Chromobacterium piscinae]MCD5326709.1 hypothetical protein [Chromobacterium piscinae]
MLTPDPPATQQRYSDADYLAFDPFQGDEAEIKCHSTKIWTARKQHLCFTLTGRQDHHIESGQRYRGAARGGGKFTSCMDVNYPTKMALTRFWLSRGSMQQSTRRWVGNAPADRAGAARSRGGQHSAEPPIKLGQWYNANVSLTHMSKRKSGMALIKAISNYFVNPEHVGHVKQNVKFDTPNSTRTRITIVYGASGQDVMFEVKTTIRTDDQIGIKVDNLLHDEIILAISEQRDAKGYEELRLQCEGLI